MQNSMKKVSVVVLIVTLSCTFSLSSEIVMAVSKWLADPKSVRVSQDRETGVLVTWKSKEKNITTTVYFRKGNGKYKAVGKTKASKYRVKSLKRDDSYRLNLRSKKNSRTSAYTTYRRSFKFVPTPKLTKVEVRMRTRLRCPLPTVRLDPPFWFI